MRRLLGCLCALLVLAGLAVPLAAAGEAAPPAAQATTETGLAPAADPVTVTGTLMEKQDRLALYEKGAPLETLTAQLDTTVYLMPLRPPYATGAVTWDFEGCGLSTTGRKTLRGLVAVPDTHVYLEDGQPATLWVERQVMVYEEGMAPIETVQPNAIDGFGPAMLVPLGSGPESLAGFMAEADYLATLETADERIIYTRAAFDPSRVDLNEAGCYFGFTYALPSCFAIAEDDPLRADVVVLRDDIVDLTFTYLETQYLSAQWLLGVWEPVLWMAKDVAPADLADEAVWAPAPEKLEKGGEAHRFSADMLDESARSFSIYLDFFYNAAGDAYEPGTYYFQVRHRDGVSNTVCVEVTKDMIRPEMAGGDKDGGDADDKDPPVIEQPPPGPQGAQPPGGAVRAENDGDTAMAVGAGGAASGADENGSGAPGGMERSTATETTVAGLRLREMMALQGERVLFQKKGFSVRFDTAFLEALALGDQDLFTVTLEALGGLRYRVGAAVNGVPLERIPGTLVELWYDGAAGLRVADEQGNELPGVVYDEAQSLVTFTVDATGTYTLLEPAATSPLPAQPVVAMAGGGMPGWGAILAACGVGLPAAGVAGGLWRRRAKARRGR